MVAHAFFKALLFLGSGSVIHALNGEQDLRKMGALQKFLPLTFPTFTIGWLAISGIPPFAGFWAKGDVLTNVYLHNKALWALGVLTAILTAYYMSRLFVLTFRGSERFRDVTHGHDPHESPWVMTVPLVILAVLSVFGGVIDLPFWHTFSLVHWLAPILPPETVVASTSAEWVLAGVDLVAAVIGLAAAFTIWKDRVSSTTFEKEFFEKVWRWDDAYDATIGRPLTALSHTVATTVDPRIIDGAVTGVAVAARRSGEGLRKVQSGFVRHYAAVMALGLAVLLVYVIARVH
jgi:NADH-quinone oxidoreductase subunit L